jgi:hypothetical protein
MDPLHSQSLARYSSLVKGGTPVPPTLSESLVNESGGDQGAGKQEKSPREVVGSPHAG